MKHNEGYFSGAGGKQLFYQSWLPEDEPKAVLLVVHGLAEHSGRYMNVVNHFVPLGYAVYGMDHIGHGKSEGPRVFVNRFEDFTNHVKNFFGLIQAEQPGKPVFILGHSMGSLISISYLLKHQDGLDGAIISGTMVKVPEHVTPATILMGKVFSALLPKLGIVGLDATHISRDPAVVEAYVNDPLVYRGNTTARLAAEMLSEMESFPAQASKISLPITIVQGGDDKLVNVNDSQILYDSISSTDKTIKIYEGYYHEVFNDPGFEVVLGDIEAWLEKQLG